METYIKKYFDLITSNLQKHLDSEMSSDAKERIEIRLQLINELRHNITWQFNNEENKQVSRLQWLANMRRSDAHLQLIKKQERAIRIYEQIKLTLPYLKALNSNLLIPVIEFVDDLCVKIDLSGYNYDRDFPDNHEIDEVFKPYFEIIRYSKGNGNIFAECYEKIEDLYRELKNPLASASL